MTEHLDVLMDLLDDWYKEDFGKLVSSDGI